MTDKQRALEILKYLNIRYGELSATLNFNNDFECLISILLSAQTTDESVNKVTPKLFKLYPTPFELQNANVSDVESVLHSIGLYRNKSKNVVLTSKILCDKYNGVVPHDLDKLIELPGVGMKTAQVFLVERAGFEGIPVDTHISRLSKRWGFASQNDNPLKIQKKLESVFPKESFNYLHHAIIQYGRDVCTAKNPDCECCSIYKCCPFYKKYLSTIAK